MPPLYLSLHALTKILGQFWLQIKMILKMISFPHFHHYPLPLHKKKCYGNFRLLPKKYFILDTSFLHDHVWAHMEHFSKI